MTKTTKVALALVTALAVTACSARSRRAPGTDPGTPSEVQVWPGMEVATVADIPNEWVAPWKNGTFFLKNLSPHRPESIASCADLAGVSESEVRLSLEWERYSLREKVIRCGALAEVRNARPARVSYVRDLVSSDDPGGVLPAVVSPSVEILPKPASAPAADPSLTASGSSRSWRASDPTLTFDRSSARAGYQELVVGGSYRGRLTWWAAGDFDGDGAEDVLMFSNLAPTAAANAPNVMRAFVLTRKLAGGPVTVVKQIR
jgi:hypothetical protein